MQAASSFQAKLCALYPCIFPDSPNPDAGLAAGVRLPAESEAPAQALASFYAVFGEHRDFLKCLYDLRLPAELAVEDGFMALAVEQQGACAYGVDLSSGKVFCRDRAARLAEPVDLRMEDFLLYLTAIQCTQYCACSGSVADFRPVLEERYSDRRLTDAAGSGAVYLFSEGVILVVSGNDAFVSSRDDDRMAAFEAHTGFDVDYF